ncbi:MAG: DUF484 family protein [Candidatus Nitrospinota bacterium M3_3B_026]
MRKDLASRSMKVTNKQLRHYNSLLRKNLRLVVSCSSENEKTQRRMDRMEDLVFHAPSLKEMFDTLIIQGQRIFEIDVITVTLEKPFQGSYPDGYHDDGRKFYLGSDRVRFSEPEAMAAYFKNPAEPVIRGGLRRGTGAFFPGALAARVRSEALAPLNNGDRVIGVAAFGSSRAERFMEGYGARFLKRLARTLTLKTEVFRAREAGAERGEGVL